MKKTDKFELIKMAYVPVLLCGITLSIWQMVHTFYWNKNIIFMKNELQNCESTLYIPEEHDVVISSFHNKELRRYIWLANYFATALSFSPDYEVKNILVNYTEKIDLSDDPLRNHLYVDMESEFINSPYGCRINIKNKFWDLTECAKALHFYNQEHNIPENQ